MPIIPGGITTKDYLIPGFGLTGFGIDGAYDPAADASLLDGLYNFTTVTIDDGITVSAAGKKIAIMAKTITISGTLTAAGKGAAGGASVTENTAGKPGNNGAGYFGGGGGGGGSTTQSGGYDGGNGGKGRANGGTGGVSSTAPTAGEAWSILDIYMYNMLNENYLAGGGGGSGGCHDGTSGAGGAGGGVIILSCDSLTVNASGVISADGNPGGDATELVSYGAGGGGGGGGGAVIILTKSYTNNGTVSADGGAGGAKTGVGLVGAAGGAGMVRVLLL